MLHPAGFKSDYCFYDAELLPPEGGLKLYKHKCTNALERDAREACQEAEDTVKLNGKHLCARCYNKELYRTGTEGGLPTHVGFTCRCERCEPANDFLDQDHNFRQHRRNEQGTADKPGALDDLHQQLDEFAEARRGEYSMIDYWLSTGEKRVNPWDKKEIAYTFQQYLAHYKDFEIAVHIFAMSDSSARGSCDPPPNP